MLFVVFFAVVSSLLLSFDSVLSFFVLSLFASVFSVSSFALLSVFWSCISSFLSISYVQTDFTSSAAELPSSASVTSDRYALLRRIACTFLSISAFTSWSEFSYSCVVSFSSVLWEAALRAASVFFLSRVFRIPILPPLISVSFDALSVFKTYNVITSVLVSDAVIFSSVSEERSR